MRFPFFFEKKLQKSIIFCKITYIIRKRGGVMTLKRIKMISVFGMFILCFLTHFLYNWFPNALFSIFFPVNESIWEHMKMMTSSILIWSVLEYFLYKKYRINHNNFALSMFLEMTLSIIIFLIIYLPIYHFTGSVFILNLIVLFISIYFVNVISYYILNLRPLHKEILSIAGIILLYIVMGILTYNPPENYIFLDTQENKYGINIYEL